MNMNTESQTQANEPPEGFGQDALSKAMKAWEDDQQTKEILRKDIAELRAKIARARHILDKAKFDAYNQSNNVHLHSNRSEIQRQGIEAALKELELP